MKKIFCVMVAVVLCFGAVLVTASAKTPLYNYNGVDMPYPPEDLADTDYKHFAIMKENNGGYTLVASTSTVRVKDVVDGVGTLFVYVGSDYILYNLNDVSWVKFGEGTAPMTGYTLGNSSSLLWKNTDSIYIGNSIFTGDSNFVFPLPKTPLHEEINGVTGEAVNGLANDTFDTLGVLVPIGIGIMALFIGVALIPRVIYKFL